LPQMMACDMAKFNSHEGAILYVNL